jgi:hypothetical protein
VTQPSRLCFDRKACVAQRGGAATKTKCFLERSRPRLRGQIFASREEFDE